MNWLYEDGRIYSNDATGKLQAEATYSYKSNGDMDVEHVYVDPSLRGQGVAGKVMEAVVDLLRKNGEKATATCSYANLWFKKHKEECKDVLSSEENSVIACRIDGRH